MVMADPIKAFERALAVQRVATRFADEADTEKEAVAPEGWEPTVKKMKKHPEIDNPWALAWYMKNKGDTPGGKEASRVANPNLDRSELWYMKYPYTPEFPTAEAVADGS